MTEATDREMKALVEIGVQKAKLDILVNDFQESKGKTDENLTRIYNLLRTFPNKVTDCRREIESDMSALYMTKKDGELLEQHLSNNIKSVKLWIVSTVSGCTATGVFILWFLKVVGMGVA